MCVVVRCVRRKYNLNHHWSLPACPRGDAQEGPIIRVHYSRWG